MSRRRLITCALVALALAGGGYALGRFTTPTKVETRTVEVTKIVEVEKEVVREVKGRDIVWTRVVEVRPDGSSTTTEREATKERVETETKRDTETTTEATREATKVVTNAKPQWRASVLVGGSLAFPIRQVVSSVEVSPAFGGHVERRLVGPFWVGAWGVGAPRGYAMGGLSLGVEF